MAKQGAHPSGIDAVRTDPKASYSRQLQASFLLWLVAVAAGLFETALVGRLSRQVHTARTPGAADQQAPLRVARRKTAAQRLTTRVGPPRTINTTTQPPAGRSRPSGGIVEPQRI